MNKIVLCALPFSSNLGENLVVETTKYNIRKQLPNEDFEFVQVDLFGRRKFIRASFPTKTSEMDAFEMPIKPNFFNWIDIYAVSGAARVLKKVSRRMYCAAMEHRWRRNPNEYRRLRAYFDSVIKDADCVWFAGGGIIEYCENQYQHQIGLIVELAHFYNCPVVFGGVGLVGEADPSDPRFAAMQHALNDPVVQHIFVRDHKETIDEVYMLDGKKVKAAADPASFCAEAFDIHADTSSDITGVGLIRPNAFSAYKKSVDSEGAVRFYKELLTELDRRGIRWQLFTNGFESEQQLGEEILKSLGKDPSLIAERPTTPRQLIEIISGYKGIITARLHGLIAAYSLGVPGVGLSWNDKVDCFMENIGYPERTIDILRQKPSEIVDIYEKAVQENYDPEKRDAFRETLCYETKNALAGAGLLKGTSV